MKVFLGDMKNWILIGTFFGLWLSTNFSDQFQSILAYILIATVGILHGTNDINIIRSESEKTEDSVFFWKVLLLYIALILVILVIFVFYPFFALILFVVFSGFHFGEQHLQQKLVQTTRWSKVLFMVYGTTILFLIFYVQADEVIPIISELTAFEWQKSFFGIGLAVLLTISLTGFIALRKILDIHIVKELFYLLILYVVFNTATLIWGFCIYFVLWHSIPSIHDQMLVLYGKTDRSSLARYLKECWPYWCVSVVGLAVVYFWFQENNLPLMNALIYLLASITIPHILVMSRLDANRS